MTTNTIRITAEVTEKMFKRPENLTLPTLVVWALASLHATTRAMSVHSTKVAQLLERLGFVSAENDRPFSRHEVRVTLKTLAKFGVVGWAHETVYRRGPKRGRKRHGGAFFTEPGFEFVRETLAQHLAHVDTLNTADTDTAGDRAAVLTQLLATSAAPSVVNDKSFADKGAKGRQPAPARLPAVPAVACASPVVLRRPDGAEYQFASVEAAAEFERLRSR